MACSKKRFPIESKSTDAIANNKETPSNIINIILEYSSLYKTGGYGNRPLISTLFTAVKSNPLKHLLTVILSGNFDETKAILEKNPHLVIEKLEEKDFVTAPSGQKANNVTAYRTALAVEDTQMAEMIKAKLIKVAGRDAASTQYFEQFPDNWEADEEKEKWAPVLTQLDKLANTIKDVKHGDITSSGHPKYKLTIREGSPVVTELEKFKLQINTLRRKTSTTGKHLNNNLLLKAYEIYENKILEYFGGWRDPRAMLFWQQVIGTIQGFLPANYVQALCDSFYDSYWNLRENKPQERALEVKILSDTPNTCVFLGGTVECEAWINTNFYPVSESGVGFDYAITSRSGDKIARRAPHGIAEYAVGTLSALTKFCQAKKNCMESLAPWYHQLSSLCVVM